jgi:hypothetical protein
MIALYKIALGAPLSLRKIFPAQGTPAAAKNPPEDPPDGDGGDDWAMTQRCLAAVLANMPMVPLDSSPRPPSRRRWDHDGRGGTRWS